MTQFSVELIRQAIAGISPEIDVRIRQRRRSRLDERSLWSELSCCILSSQVPYQIALAAALHLDSDGVLYERGPQHRERVECRVMNLLLSPMNVNGAHRRYRFPISRARQLGRAWDVVGREWGTLTEFLDSRQEPDSMREWLVQYVPGLGPKQASMFLRNVAASYDMAVIDRHVVRYMAITGLCSSKPGGLASLRAYKDYEARLRVRAQELGYSVGVLDWAIWIVMRLVQP